LSKNIENGQVRNNDNERKNTNNIAGIRP